MVLILTVPDLLPIKNITSNTNNNYYLMNVTKSKEKRIEKLHAEGKMTARERIDYLLDPKKESIEIGAFVGDGMYAEHGGCPSGGVVVKIGYIKGKQCVVVALSLPLPGAWIEVCP